MWLTQLLAPVTGVAKEWMAGRTKIKEAKLDIKLAEMENTARLLREKEGFNAQWEQAQLKQTSKTLRLSSFVILSTPFVAAVFVPERVNEYFTVALAAIPVWFVQMYMSIIGAIWAIGELKNSLPSLISGVKGSIQKK